MAMNTTPHYLDSTTGKLVQAVSTGGAVNVSLSSGIDGRGNYPNTWWLQDSATIASTTTDNAVVYTSGDVSMYDYHVVENASPVDAVSIQVTLDGTNWSADYPLTGTVAATPLIEPGEFGVIEGKFYQIKVLKDGTTSEVPLIRFAHAVK